MESSLEPIKTICSNCGKRLDDLKRDSRFILCPCGLFMPIGANSYHKLKGGKIMVETKVAAKKAPVNKEKKKSKKYDETIDKKVIDLYKSGTTKFTEISKAMNGSPAVPKIRRILKAKGLI